MIRLATSFKKDSRMALTGALILGAVICIPEILYAKAGDMSGGPSWGGVEKTLAITISLGAISMGSWAYYKGKALWQILAYAALGSLLGPIIIIGGIIAFQELASKGSASEGACSNVAQTDCSNPPERSGRANLISRL